MANLLLSVNNPQDFGINDSVTILGKNGFTTVPGSLPLLVRGLSYDDNYITLAVRGLDCSFDYNYGCNLLGVINTYHSSNNKGNTSIQLPLYQKSSDVDMFFPGYSPEAINQTIDVYSYNVTSNTIIIQNIETNSVKVSDMLLSPPFYIKLHQVLDPNIFYSNFVFIEGTRDLYDLSYNVANYSSGTHDFTLGPNNNIEGKSLISVYIDGIRQSDSSYTFSSNSNAISITLSGSPKEVRVVTDRYTVPAVEPGDNLFFYTNNTYSVLGTTYNPYNNFYNGYLTANSVYGVVLSEKIRSNIAGVSAINISDDLQGNIANISGNYINVFYNSNTYPGRYELKNYGIYYVASNLAFEVEMLDTDKKIVDLEPGNTVIQVQSRNFHGNLSKINTKLIEIKPIPIQKVENLDISELIITDTSQGAILKPIISFTHIVNQEVTDYEISYRVLGPNGEELEQYNTVKVPASGVDETGMIRFTVPGIVRGLVSGGNTFEAKVTPLNRAIQGITTYATESIIGKTARPNNIVSLSGGQRGDSAYFSWQIPTSDSGAIADIDLLEIIMRRYPGSFDASEVDTKWDIAEEVQRIATPATSTTVEIPQYRDYTYLIKTRDTSGNESNNIVTAYVDFNRPPDVEAYKAWSDDSPTSNLISNQNNENYTENSYVGVETLTGGLKMFGSTVYDNANASSYGFSISGTDLVATANAYYQTPIRNVGDTVLGTLVVEANGSMSLSSFYTSYKTAILTGVNDITPSSNVLKDLDFGGIGHILGFNNSYAATVSYNSYHKTLVSGGTGGNIYAVWNEGQFTNDVANANSYALIAGVANGNAIVFSNTYYANGRWTGGNTLPNLTTKSSTYKLVDLNQFLDSIGSTVTAGDSTLISTNIEVRYSSASNIYYANGNVNVKVFTDYQTNDGWKKYSIGEKEFSYYQVKFSVLNRNPSQASYTLDILNETIDLKRKTYSDTVRLTQSPYTINYSNAGFKKTPTVVATMRTQGPFTPIVLDPINTTTANLVAINTVSLSSQVAVNVAYIATGI